MAGDVTPELFREAVSRYATGLTVVTCTVDGVDHAMTASSFVSVSLEPLLVLVSVELTTRFHEAMTATDRWAVSILPVDGAGQARWFATPGRGLPDQFDGVPAHRGAMSGALLLDGALAVLECRTEQVVRAGDHDLTIGAVTALELGAGDVEPLVYHRRSYRSLAPREGR